jgi:PAS domain S-box-containing protein
VTSDPIELRAFRYAPMGVIVARPDGVIVASNPAAGQLLGRDPAELLGSVVFVAIHRDDVEDVEQRYAGLLAGGTPAAARWAGRLGIGEHLAATGERRAR